MRGRRGARTTALTSGGTIPDTADYQVLLEPENQIIGTVNEDFAVESMAGDIFQLGNASYRIQRVERGTVRVEDAKGQPPTIPFWLGEAPGRTDELSVAVSRLRAEIAALLAFRLVRNGRAALACRARSASSRPRPISSSTISPRAFPLLARCRRRTRSSSSGSSTRRAACSSSFISPFGSRLNRAWGLALRKRFCRKFNFELQAAATEDNIVLSLTTAHSFELGDVARYLHSNSVRDVLVQAMLDAPMFTTRWRWVAGVSLALPRFRGGKKVPPQLLRMQAEDLVAAVFPDQIACAENLVGEREVPDHPLTNQAISDCLHEAMDIEGLERLLRRLESGDVRGRRLRSDRALAARARGFVGQTLRLPRRRAARGAADAGRHGAGDGATLRARPTLAGSTPRRSPRFSPRPGPIPSTRRNCMTRCCGSAA